MWEKEVNPAEEEKSKVKASFLEKCWIGFVVYEFRMHG